MGGRTYPDNERIRHYRAKRGSYYRPRGLASEVEVRYFDPQRPDIDDGEIDEIVTTNVHLETMSDKAVWMDINGLHVWFHCHRGRIRITAEAQGCEPFVVTPEMATADQ